MSEKITLPISIVIAGLLIAGGIYMNGKVSSVNPTPAQQQQVKSKNLAGVVRPVDANDHVLGSAKARVLVIEYSDTECPYCKVFHNTMISIMQEYGKDEQVAWVYRHLPIPQLHSKAPKEAEALECAGNLGGNSKFWEYTNKLYETTTSNNGLDPKELTNIAKLVGLSSTAFDTCVSSGEFTPRVNLDIQNAGEIGFAGTPSSVIVDTKKNEYYPIEGAYPYAQVKSVIDLILKS
ncbi:MAG: DsbA family protein [Candidatus Paceibacterota bacterium]|jgi:protein-disulfide isomerase